MTLQQSIAHWCAYRYEIEETDTEDVDFLLRCLRGVKGRVLEIACGGGRILVPLAKAGYDVYGVDIDPEPLRYIADKAKGLTNIRWALADAYKDELGEGYDATILACNLLMNLVTDGGFCHNIVRMLERAAQTLKSGGLLYIDVNLFAHPEEIYADRGNERTIFAGKDDTGADLVMSLIDKAPGYDPKTQTIHYIRRFHGVLGDGQAIDERRAESKRIVALDELKGWLTDLGLTIEALYGDYQGGPLSEETSRCIVVARKA